MLIIEDIESFA